ncbi:hypothetical protein ACFE04_017750 [Oxalis oulophora]
MEVIRCRVGFTNCMAVSSEGRGGGLAVLWSDDVKVEIKSFSSYHIDLVVDYGWICTGFYGHPVTSMRTSSWDCLDALCSGKSISPGQNILGVMESTMRTDLRKT